MKKKVLILLHIHCECLRLLKDNFSFRTADFAQGGLAAYQQ